MQANKAKFQAKSAAKDAGIDLPVSAPALYDYGALQTDVGFLGFGKSADRAASKVCKVSSHHNRFRDYRLGFISRFGKKSE